MSTTPTITPPLVTAEGTPHTDHWPGTGLWRTVPNAGYATVVARRPGGSALRGRTDEVDARWVVGPRPGEGLLVVEVGTTRLRTGHPRLDRRLRSPNWLDSGGWPSIFLRSAILDRRGRSGTAPGELTVTDRTVTLEMAIASRGPRYRRSSTSGFLVELWGSTSLEPLGYAPTWAQPLELSLALHLELTRHHPGRGDAPLRRTVSGTIPPGLL